MVLLQESRMKIQIGGIMIMTKIPKKTVLIPFQKLSVVYANTAHTKTRKILWAINIASSHELFNL